MFELSIALKYLIPRKKHLSVTLIAFLSVGAISLVVWLLLVFLSVTEGMERSWLKKLTDLNAPIRITPTPHYFSSYYYRIDALSSASNYNLKTLEEKLLSSLSDPYDPNEDPELPPYLPKPHIDTQGRFVDPIKRLDHLLHSLKEEEPSLLFQDYEMSGATLKLQMLRKGEPESLHFLTQVSYLSTPPRYASVLQPLLLPPSLQDIEHLFFLANYRMEGTLSNNPPQILREKPSLERMNTLFSCLRPTHLVTLPSQFLLPLSLLPKDRPFVVYGTFQGGRLTRLLLPLSPLKEKQGVEVGTLCKGILSFPSGSFPAPAFLSLDGPLSLQTTYTKSFSSEEFLLPVRGTLQGHTIEGMLPWQGLSLSAFTLQDETKAPWAHALADGKIVLPRGPQGEMGILLPKSFKEAGVLLGDKGFLAYTSSTASALQEQRASVIVVGFYDPGILSIGNKCLLVPSAITRTINASNTSFVFDKIALNGFQVWFSQPFDAKKIKQKIEDRLKKEEINDYFQVVTFEEFDFAKDLLQQFQSDKYLFSLIGILILFVACCNILSFLIIQVSDRKKEIAILQAMGASKKSIAFIFGTLGVCVGCVGSLLGFGAALLTLHNIDTLVSILSALQGHDAFNAAFYGSSLPSTLSSRALLFIMISTPILSLLAGIIPALKACHLHPSHILRSES